MKKLTLAELHEQRARMAGYDDAQVLDAEDLAVLLGTTRKAIYRRLYKSPSSLPPCLPGFGASRRWSMGVHRKWVQELAGSKTPDEGSSPSSKRPGRPRKAP